MIWYQLRDHTFEDYFTTGRKNRYELLCAIDAYNKVRTLGPEDSSSGGVIPLPSTLSIDALESLGHTPKFIHNFFQYFIDNYEVRNFLHKENIQELFREIPLSLPIKSW